MRIFIWLIICVFFSLQAAAELRLYNFEFEFQPDGYMMDVGHYASGGHMALLLNSETRRIRGLEFNLQNHSTGRARRLGVDDVKVKSEGQWFLFRGLEPESGEFRFKLEPRFVEMQQLIDDKTLAFNIRNLKITVLPPSSMSSAKDFALAIFRAENPMQKVDGYYLRRWYPDQFDAIIKDAYFLFTHHDKFRTECEYLLGTDMPDEKTD